MDGRLILSRFVQRLPLEVRRRLFLDLSAEIAEELDAQGVDEEMLQQDFEAFRAERRRR